MKLHNHSDGFSPLHILLVLVILGIVGFTGWYVWHSKQSVDVTLAKTAPSHHSVVAPPAAAVDKYADWKSYTGNDFSAKYPNGWNVLDANLGDADPNLKSTYFSTDSLVEDKEPNPYNALITVSVFHSGYYMGDVDGERQLLGSSTDAATFARNMNGLAPNELFKQVRQETRTIGGQEAIKYIGGKFDTPWTLKSGTSIYQFQNIQGEDLTKIKQSQVFDQFLSIVKIP